MPAVTPEERRSTAYTDLKKAYEDVYQGRLKGENLHLLITQIVADFYKDQQKFIQAIRYLTDITMQRDPKSLGRTGGNTILFTEVLKTFMSIHDKELVNAFKASREADISKLQMSDQTALVFAAINDVLPEADPSEHEQHASDRIATKANAGSRLAIKTINLLLLPPEAPQDCLVLTVGENALKEKTVRELTSKIQEKGMVEFFKSFKSSKHNEALTRLQAALENKEPLEQYQILIDAYEQVKGDSGKGKYASHLRCAIHYLAKSFMPEAARLQKIVSKPAEGGRLCTDLWFSSNAERGREPYMRLSEDAPIHDAVAANEDLVEEQGDKPLQRRVAEALTKALPEGEDGRRQAVANASRAVIQALSAGKSESDFTQPVIDAYVEAVKEDFSKRGAKKNYTKLLDEVMKAAQRHAANEHDIGEEPELQSGSSLQ